LISLILNTVGIREEQRVLRSENRDLSRQIDAETTANASKRVQGSSARSNKGLFERIPTIFSIKLIKSSSFLIVY